MCRALMFLFILLNSSSPADAARSALEGKEELWFICLLIASGGVAIGCVLEIPETLADLREWRKLRKEGTESPSWRVPMAAVGLLLVVLGVIGEGVFEALVSINETALRAHDEQALADTIKEAGTAKDSAEKAQEAAELASKASVAAMGKATEASGKADSVFSIAARAGEVAKGALTAAGDAKAQVGEVQTNIAKVDEKYAPRTLSKDKRDILVQFLSNTPIKPEAPVSVDTCVDAPDGAAYAKEIVDAINDPQTGWRAKSGNTWTSNGTGTGVGLMIHDLASAPQWAGELQKALRTAGIGGDGILHPEIKAGDAVILVQRKN